MSWAHTFLFIIKKNKTTGLTREGNIMKTTKTTFLASNKLNEVKNKLEDTDVQNQLVSVLEKI